MSPPFLSGLKMIMLVRLKLRCGVGTAEVELPIYRIGISNVT